MASLGRAGCIEILNKPKNKPFIERAAFQEERLLFHGEPIVRKMDLPFRAHSEFTTWWRSLVSTLKYQRLDSVLTTPFYTVSIVKDIFDRLQKFVDAQDRYIEFKFVSEDYTNDYNKYLESINDETFWKQKVMNELKTGICSYVVIDLPAQQKSMRPEPYSYFVAPRNMIDVDLNRYSGNVEYIAYKQSDFYWDAGLESSASSNALSLISASFRDGDKMEKAIVIDDDAYRVFVKRINKYDENGLRQTNEWMLYSESLHDLKYCPVIDFWSDYVKGSNGIDKLGPITLQLANFDYILFFKACVSYMNLYGPFPVIVSYDMSEDEFDDKSRETNIGQYWNQANYSSVSSTLPIQDPRKSAGRDMIAPGGGFQVPVPSDASDHDFMNNPMKFVGMDPLHVEKANELVCKFEQRIFEKCTGIDKEYLNEIAKNKEMLSASFGSEETILTWIKTNIERVHRFVTKTRCYLRYGQDYFKGCTIDYGSDYLLKDSQTLSNEFKTSTDNGMPQGYCDEISGASVITRFKNNPDKLARLRILNDLEPYKNLSWEQIQSLEINKTDVINFIIKANFISFVNRFELENTNIVEFGSAISYTKKIEAIKNQLKEYANELKPSWKQSTDKSGATSASGEGNN